MTPDQAAELAQYLKDHRERAGVAMYSLATQLGINRTQLHRLELGQILNPRPEILAGYATATGVSLADIYAVAGIPAPRELPTLRPYLRTKYRKLSAEDADRVEAFVADLMRQQGSGGPDGGEDELE